MTRPFASLSVTAWKWLLGALVFVTLVLVCDEWRHAWVPLSTGQEGSLGVRLNSGDEMDPSGPDTHGLAVRAVDPDSQLGAAGAAPGQVLRFARPLDRWRRFAIGEHVGVRLRTAAGTRALTVDAQPRAIRFADQYDYLSRCALTVLALGFSLLVGFKQAGASAYRSLSLCFWAISLTMFYTFVYAPPGPLQAIAKFANLVTYPLIWYLLVDFATAFQPYPATLVRTLLRRLLPGFRLLAAGTAMYAFWFGLGHDAPGLAPLNFAGIGIGLVLTIASLLDGRRQAHGEMRQRHAWLLLSVAAGALPTTMLWLPALDQTWHGVRWTLIGSFAGQFLMYAGLAYATLRHRIFDFGFTISRALVYSVVSLLLLSVFGLLGWMAGPLVHGEGRTHHGFGDAAIALGVYLTFHHVHHRVEHWVERILFQKWHDEQERLREFVRRAAHITNPEVLLTALVAALDDFTHHAGVAVYLGQADGGFRLAAGNLDKAPPLLRQPGFNAYVRKGALPCVRLPAIGFGELALPMSQRGALDGFVILGGKGGVESYRPDEQEVLAYAVHQVGLDLGVLQVEHLETRMADLAQEAALQDAEMRMLAGRRSGLRGAPAPG